MDGNVETAYIALGSNIEPDENMPRAIEALAEHVQVTGVSMLYRTPAMDRPDDPSFINGVCRIETNIEPRALKFEVLRGIETALGRVRMEDAYAPRTIDLDILLYGNHVINEAGLNVPDPDLRTRPFLAVPLLELWPEAMLPDTGEALADIVAEMNTGLVAVPELRKKVDP